MHSRLRRIGTLAAILSLPVALGGGCTPAFDFLVCFVSDHPLPGTEAVKVKTKCGAWPFAPGVASPVLSKNAFVIKGTGANARYESGPPILETTEFEVTMDFGVDVDSNIVQGETRGYLRFEDEEAPPHFIEVSASPNASNGYDISAVNEVGSLGLTVHVTNTQFVRLKIVRGPAQYSAFVTPSGGSIVAVGAPVNIPTGGLRLRFGADGLAKGARVYFHELIFSAFGVGDAVLSPAFSSITTAFTQVAMINNAVGLNDFATASTDLGLMVDALSLGIDLIAAGKGDGSIAKRNQPKLALAALKSARKSARRAHAIADKLVAGTGGSVKALGKRVTSAFEHMMLACVNLAGAKTQDAKEVADHVQLRG